MEPAAKLSRDKKRRVTKSATTLLEVPTCNGGSNVGGEKKKEGRREEKRRVSVEGEGREGMEGEVEVEADPKKSLKFVDWSQNANEVTVTLFTGRRLGARDIAIDFSEQEVKVGLTDGRKWLCRFLHRIVASGAKYQLRKCKVLLVVQKHQPGLVWNQLQETPGATGAEKIACGDPVILPGHPLLIAPMLAPPVATPVMNGATVPPSSSSLKPSKKTAVAFNGLSNASVVSEPAISTDEVSLPHISTSLRNGHAVSNSVIPETTVPTQNAENSVKNPGNPAPSLVGQALLGNTGPTRITLPPVLSPSSAQPSIVHHKPGSERFVSPVSSHRASQPHDSAPLNPTPALNSFPTLSAAWSSQASLPLIPPLPSVVYSIPSMSHRTPDVVYSTRIIPATSVVHSSSRPASMASARLIPASDIPLASCESGNVAAMDVNQTMYDFDSINTSTMSMNTSTMPMNTSTMSMNMPALSIDTPAMPASFSEGSSDIAEVRFDKSAASIGDHAVEAAKLADRWIGKDSDLPGFGCKLEAEHVGCNYAAESFICDPFRKIEAVNQEMNGAFCVGSDFGDAFTPEASLSADGDSSQCHTLVASNLYTTASVPGEKVASVAETSLATEMEDRVKNVIDANEKCIGAQSRMDCDACTESGASRELWTGGRSDKRLNEELREEGVVKEEVTYEEAMKEEAIKEEVMTEEVAKEVVKEGALIEEPAMELDFLKHDSYERSQEVHALCVSVKLVCKETLRVSFEPFKVTLNFQTADEKFRQSYPGVNADSRFQWKVELANEIVTRMCSYSVSSHKVEMQLVKKVPRKWTSLTPPPPVPGVGPVGASNTWMPLIPPPPPPPPPAVRPIAPTKKGSVMFDELSSDAPPRRIKTDFLGGEEGVEGASILNRKPTCTVSPLSSSVSKPTVGSTELAAPTVGSRGLVGLDNLGNTCFMNCVLQILANTPGLRQYFLDGSYRDDVNRANPLGMGGRLAEAFASLMRVLWMSNHESYPPEKLKSLVAEKQTSFAGFSQHDAEEFMEFLLDGLHEDMNRVKVKPYIAVEDSDVIRSNEVMADEAWARHRARNDSLISDVFQGQYRSKLTCPLCNKVSITFDPFSVIQVPIARKKLVDVVFMSTSPNKRPVELRLHLAAGATILDLKVAVAQRMKTLASNIRVLEVCNSRVVNYFLNARMEVSKTISNSVLLACEVYSEQAVGEPVRELVVYQRAQVPLSVPASCSYCCRDADEAGGGPGGASGGVLKRCASCFKTAYCGQACQKADWTRHKPVCRVEGELVGCPFVVSVPASQLSHHNLCSLVEAYSRYSVNTIRPPANAMPHRSSSLLVIDALTDESQPCAAAQPDQSASSAGPEADQSGERYHEVPRSDGVLPDTTVAVDDVAAIDGDISESDNQEVPNLSPEAVGVSTLPVGGTTPPVRCVLATKLDAPPRKVFPFALRLCNSKGILVHDGENVQDTEGSDVLDLPACVKYVAMVWNNRQRGDSFVQVVHKSLQSEMEPFDINDRNGPGAGVTLQDCLTLFSEPEVLSAEQSWYCPRCKNHCQATKEMSLWRLAPTIIIHLKRFSYTNIIWRGKVDDKVSYPLAGLDLSPYYKGQMRAGEPTPVYDLYGVAMHHGSLLGGHYSSFARCPHPTRSDRNQHGWRLFDDSDVTPCNESNVVTRSAYVLFYQRRDQPDASPLCQRSQAAPHATLVTPSSSVVTPSSSTLVTTPRSSLITQQSTLVTPPSTLVTPAMSQVPPLTTPTLVMAAGRENADQDEVDLDDIKIASSLNDDLETDIDLMD